MSARTIIGFDPGSLNTGFGIIHRDHEGTVSHISHGAMVLDAKKAVTERLQDLSRDVHELVSLHRPHMVVIEEAFVFKNPRSALILGQARGVIIAILGLNHIPCVGISPTEAKLIVCGHGRAQKFQMSHFVALRLGIEPPKGKDAGDALGLALALALKMNGALPLSRPQAVVA
jgi:crossover junction endodeoxyribonuclease RuvC